MDGIVLAAGVKRLGWEERINQILSENMLLPAVGEGSIALETVEKQRKMPKKRNESTVGI